MVRNVRTIFKFFTYSADGMIANLQRLRDLSIAFLRRVFQLFGDEVAAVCR
jgi:hypothetical protein